MIDAPRASVRLQLRNGVDFDAVRATLDYHAALGISHLYLSPILCAQPGSTHGYDIVDFGRVDPALGGESGLRRLAAAAHARHMGLIVDFVPNHMGVGPHNAWWQDVQRWGRASPHAAHFDIQWTTLCDTPRRLLLPVLDCDYAVALAQRQFTLTWHHGEPFVGRGEQCFPLGPATLPDLLRMAEQVEAADQVEQALASHADKNAAREAVRNVLDHAGWQVALNQCWDSWLSREPARIDAVLSTQAYRLAHWRCANDCLNWRRFFHINQLAGLRIERDATYAAVHATMLRLHAERIIDGLRIDHIDGLAAPGAYCRRLRADLQRARSGEKTWLVVEKVLAAGENLPATWPVDGTTGYDFMDQVSSVLHDARAESALTRLYQRLTGDRTPFAEHQRRARHEVLHSLLACDLRMVCQRLQVLTRASAEARDLSVASLRRVVATLLESFHAYRCYLGDDDDAALRDALPDARAHTARADRAALDFLVASLRHGQATQAGRSAVARFEQLAAPVAAKAVEDTAFYRYPRLLSRNEVGSNPAIVGTSVAAFHRACTQRRQAQPWSMLATASHDHKLGEDARMRLATLTQCPRHWAAFAQRAMYRWDRCGLDAVDRYRLLQMLIATWPADLEPADEAALRLFARRLQDWQTKALREACLRTTWTEPDRAYEARAQCVLDAMFDSASFLRDVHRFVTAIAPAGALSSLAQLTLRCTVPGIPDLYQGREWWDHSMVDPDNRRPIDFAARQTRLTVDAPLASLLAHWRDGQIKQNWLARLLHLRKRHPDGFAQGSYEPVAVSGRHADRVIAFVRRWPNGCLLVVVPRCPLPLLRTRPVPCIPSKRWQDTAITLPASIDARQLVSLASGRMPTDSPRVLALADLLDGVPVDVLVSNHDT